MATEAPSSGTSAMSGRAAVARLTLQLRASLQEAAAAEAKEVGADQDAALAQLRARLGPLVEERRRSLDKALEQARADSEAAVAAAHREAAAIVAAAATSPVAVEAVTAAVEEAVAPVIDPVAPPEEVDLPVAEVVTVVPNIPPQALVASAADGHGHTVPTLPPINVVIDAEAFARVFATVFSAMLDDRVSAGRFSAPPVQALAPAKPTMRHARHLDVVLLGLATVIVLVILASWLA